MTGLPNGGDVLIFIGMIAIARAITTLRSAIRAALAAKPIAGMDAGEVEAKP